MQQEPKQVFISYSSYNKRRATELRNMLEEHRISCWMDERNISGGEDFKEEIPKAIEQCYVLVLILTAQAQASKYVIREVDQAVKMHKIVIPYIPGSTPFRIDNNFDFLISGCQAIGEQWGRKAAEERLLSDVRKAIEKSSAEGQGKNDKNKLNQIWSDSLFDQQEDIQPNNKYIKKTLSEMAETARSDARKCIDVHNLALAAGQRKPSVFVKLGEEYYRGNNIKKNVKKAVYWFCQAAHSDDPDALYYIGECYRHGKGVRQSYAKAEYWYALSLEKKEFHRRSICAMGDLHCQGKGTKKDVLKAAKLYLKAAKNENAQTAETVEDVLGTLRYMSLIRKSSGSDKECLKQNGYTLERLATSKRNRAAEIGRKANRSKIAVLCKPIGTLCAIATASTALMKGVDNCPAWQIPCLLQLIPLSVVTSLLLANYYSYSNPTQNEQINCRKFWNALWICLLSCFAVAGGLNLVGLLAGQAVMAVLSTVFWIIVLLIILIVGLSGWLLSALFAPLVLAIFGKSGTDY